MIAIPVAGTLLKESGRVLWSAGCAAAALVSTLQAQATDSSTAIITAAELTRHVRVIADDSMQGRDTPSRGLELTAKYIADQFSAFGLGGAGNSPNWIMPYKVPDRFDFVRSQLTVTSGRTTAVASFETAAYLGDSDIPSGPVSGNVLLIAGPHTSATLAGVRDRGVMVLYVPPVRVASLSWREALPYLRPGNRGVIAVSDLDSATFAGRIEEARRQAVVGLGASRGIMHLRAEGIVGLPALLAAAGVDLAALRNATTPIVREVPSVQMKFEPQLVKVAGESKTAPNVLGKLVGHNPRLKNEYLLFVARMDHRDPRAVLIESATNPVDDNAVGAAGLIALAKAFSQSGAKPGRTLVFLAVSGGAKELWGSRDLAMLFQGVTGISDAPRVSAVINLDLAGPASGDSLRIAGLDEVMWSKDPTWIAAAHPELRLTLVKGSSLFRPTSDHFPFAEAWMPSLSLQRIDPQTGNVSINVLRFDAEQAARIVQFAFYLGLELSVAEKSPQWTVESRQRLTRGTR